MLQMTGSTVFLKSITSPAAEIITVPGENTSEPSLYFCVMERESLPVGILMPRAMANSLAAVTAAYSLASSPGLPAGPHPVGTE